ncbi:MAG: YegS/Rv2252/BmrU family lipid kinase [Xanthomonadales bacterium]|nr:YegS/Rv2252/BmrU family lipid kinase [Xanthomonadales bacterium]
MRLLLVPNSCARSGQAGKQLDGLRLAMDNLGLDAELLDVNSAEQVTRGVASARLAEFDAVVAAGGDGTLFRVLNGLVLNANSCPLGVIPLGTGNAFARDLGLLKNEWIKALDIIHRGRTRAADIGEVRCADRRFYFLNIVGIGFVVEAGITASRLKFTGPVSYSLAALWNMLRLKHQHLEFVCDGASTKIDSLFLELSNSRYTGTNFLIAPEARIDDGLLDLTLLNRVSRGRLLRLFPTIFSGRHVQFEEVQTGQIRELELLKPAGMPLMADGELIGQTPARIRCLPAAIDLLC